MLLLSLLFFPLVRVAGVDVTLRLNKLVVLFRPPRAEDVGNGRRLLSLDLMQQRGEHSPGFKQLVGADEVDLGAGEDV